MCNAVTPVSHVTKILHACSRQPVETMQIGEIKKIKYTQTETLPVQEAIRIQLAKLDQRQAKQVHFIKFTNGLFDERNENRNCAMRSRIAMNKSAAAFGGPSSRTRAPEIVCPSISFSLRRRLYLRIDEMGITTSRHNNNKSARCLRETPSLSLTSASRRVAHGYESAQQSMVGGCIDIVIIY